MNQPLLRVAHTYTVEWFSVQLGYLSVLDVGSEMIRGEDENGDPLVVVTYVKLGMPTEEQPAFKTALRDVCERIVEYIATHTGGFAIITTETEEVPVEDMSTPDPEEI